VLWWRQESKSRWYAARTNLWRTSRRVRYWRWCKWNANRWLRTFGPAAQALF